MSDIHTKLQCEIVCDLLPLYHDGVVTETTRKAVAEHLDDCESCMQEYRLLQAALPLQPAQSSTGSKFAVFSKNLKKKRIVTAFIAAVLACALLAGVFYVLTQVPLVSIPDSEFTVHRVYRCEIDGMVQFFLLYETPSYGAPASCVYEIRENDDGSNTLVLPWRKPIIAHKFSSTYVEVLTTQHIVRDGDLNALQLGSTVIWTEAENGSDPVPDYVYALLEHSDSGIGYSVDITRNIFCLQFEDGRIMEWDLDGNLLSDTSTQTP